MAAKSKSVQSNKDIRGRVPNDKIATKNNKHNQLTEIETIEYRQLEDQILEKEEIIKAITELTYDAVIIMNGKGIITFWNDAASKMFGYSKEEAIGKNLYKLITPERFIKAQLSAFSHFSKTGKGAAIGKTVELYAIGKNQIEFPIELSFSSINIKGEWFAVGIIRDISERKQAELNNKERIKKLNCLIGISKIIETPNLSLKEIFLKVVNLVPASWQYPKIASCLIIIDKTEYKEPKFKKTNWILSSKIKVNGKNVGTIEICYLEETPNCDEGPFLKEERLLINAIAERLGRVVERNLAESALKESDERYRIIFDMAPDGLFISDLKGVTIEMNHAIEKILGLEREEIIGKNFFRLGLIKPSQIPKARKILTSEIFSRVQKSEVLTITRRDGTEIHIALNVHFINYLGKKHMLGIARDVTETKQFEDKIQEAIARHSAMIENIGDVIAIMGVDGITKYQSPNIERWFGWKQEDIINTNGWNNVHPDDIERIQEEYRKLLEKETASIVEFRFKCKDGTYKWIELTALNRINHPGINGVLLNYHDITERKSYQKMINKRIVSLTQPLSQDAHIPFDELFNLDDIQRIQDEFANATGVASRITHPNGKPITRPSNSTRLCYDIIRETEKGCANCILSDAAIGSPKTDGPNIQPCLSGGLWDAGASIIVGGHHIANWLIGQVRDETQTDEAMIAYARQIGANETAVLDAFHEVPSMSHEHFTQVAQALYTLANQLSNSAYQNMQQARYITELKETEEALRESEENFRALVTNAPDIIMLLDRHGKIIYVNHDIGELSSDKAFDANVSDFIAPEHTKTVMNAIETAFNDNKSTSYEVTGRGPNGKTAYYSTHLGPIKQGGEVMAAIQISTDITERKQTEQLIHQKNEFLKLILDSLTHPFFVINVSDYTVSIANSAALNGQLSSCLTCHTITHKRNTACNSSEHPCPIKIIKKTKKAVILEHVHYDDEGNLKNIEVHAHPIFDSKGNVFQVIEYYIDITERKRAEEALLESTRKLKEAQEMAHLGFWIWDVKSGEIEWSKEIFKIFGLDPATFTPQIDSILALSPWPEDYNRNTKLINHAVKSHMPGHYEQKFLRPDKSIGYYYSTFQGKYDENGIITSIVGTVLDITERKQAQEKIKNFNTILEQQVQQRTNQLANANKELEQSLQLIDDKDRFISILAHDLKNPFNVILGFANLLVENIHEYDANSIKQQVNNLINSAQSAYNLLEELLKWTQSQSGKMPFEPQKLNFSETCLEVIQTLKPNAISKNITIKDSNDKKATLYADVNMLKTVLRNIISNAIKFCMPGGLIVVSSKKTKSNLTITISDNGVGMTPKKLKNLFDLTKIHSTTGTAEEKGTGLGLVLCKEFIEKHNGKIWVESESEKGSKFIITLPLNDKKLIQDNF